MNEFQILLTDFNWWIALAVMFGYVVVDGLYAKYTLEVMALKPYMSATIGSGIHLLMVFGVINYTENLLYIFPLVIGSWVGTFLMVNFEKRKTVVGNLK